MTVACSVGHLYYTPHSQSSGNIVEEEEERLVEPEVWKDSYKTVSSGHDRTTARRTLNGWTSCTRPAQDEAIQNPSIEERGDCEVPPYLMSYWQLVAGGGGCQLSADVWPLVDCSYSDGCPHPCICWHHLLALVD